MRTKNTLLLAAVSAFALMMTTATANATYQCTWSDGIKVCGNELGFAPSAGGESDRRDQHSGDHDSGGGSGGASSDGGDGGDGGDDGDSGSGGSGNGNGGGQGNNGGGNGGGDGSPNGKDDEDR
jgi:hypothetical protein